MPVEAIPPSDAEVLRFLHQQNFLIKSKLKESQVDQESLEGVRVRLEKLKYQLNVEKQRKMELQQQISETSKQLETKMKLLEKLKGMKLLRDKIQNEAKESPQEQPETEAQTETETATEAETETESIAIMS